MHYSQIDFSKIKYKYILEPTHIDIKYGNNNDKLVVLTPIMTVPFGIDKIYDKIYTKLQFDDYIEDSDMNSFYSTMLMMEEHLKNYLKENVDDDSELISEFKFSKSFPPLINVKISTLRNKIITKFMSSNNSELSYWDIKKGSKVKCIISLNGIWKVNNKFYYKWVLENVIIV